VLNLWEEIMRSVKKVALVLLSLFFVCSSADAKEFILGVELPLTGAFARVGKGTHEGIVTGVEMFNKKHPGNTIKLITIDDESSPAKAVAAVEKLAAQGVPAITGGYGSNSIGPASNAADKAGIVYMTSGGVANELTSRGLKHFFRTNGTDGYTSAITGLLSDAMKVKSVSIIASSLQSCAELGNNVEKALKARGIKVAMHRYDPATTDFKSIVNKVKLQDRSEAIFMSSMENDYVGIIRAAKVLRPNLKAVVGVWSLATTKMASEFPDLMQNVYGAAMLPYPADFRDKEGKEFAAAYKRLYKKDPDYLAQFGYVQVQILGEAMLRAEAKGTLAKGGLADEVRKTRLNTLVGPVSFDKTGDNQSFEQRMGQHQNGKIPIVYPKEHASGYMNFPAVPW
jgi:branched-chain amino acid transport system substrate-binding protein